MSTDLPPVGAWVRVCTNTTPGSPTFLGLVVQHRVQPDRIVVMNMRGGIVADSDAISEVLTTEQVAHIADITADQVQAIYQRLLADCEGAQ